MMFAKMKKVTRAFVPTILDVMNNPKKFRKPPVLERYYDKRSI
jgi:hypothetical protein